MRRYYQSASWGHVWPLGGFYFFGDQMNSEEFERRLSAILSADVAGYSRLMGEDDNATVRALIEN